MKYFSDSCSDGREISVARMSVRISRTRIGAAIACAVLLGAMGFSAQPARAVEQFVTTAGLLRSAPHVAHVRVKSSRSVPGIAAIEYELEVLEALKGRLPGQIFMRMFSGFQVVNPGGGRHVAGSEWIVFLGRGESGLYPIRSLQWGRIDVATHATSGEQYLMKKLSGFPRPNRGNYHSLQEFRGLAKQILAGKRFSLKETAR
ncbi:MAG: hypothetical protein NXI24_17350 [bacterium]|nr:hypothetical protein [bacterium]